MKCVFLELEDEQVEFLDKCGDRSAAARKLLTRAMLERDCERKLRKIVREELARYCSNCAGAAREATRRSGRDVPQEMLQKTGIYSGGGRLEGKNVMARRQKGKKDGALKDGALKEDIVEEFQSELDRLFNL